MNNLMIIIMVIFSVIIGTIIWISVYFNYKSYNIEKNMFRYNLNIPSNKDIPSNEDTYLEDVINKLFKYENNNIIEDMELYYFNSNSTILKDLDIINELNRGIK